MNQIDRSYRLAGPPGRAQTCKPSCRTSAEGLRMDSVPPRSGPRWSCSLRYAVSQFGSTQPPIRSAKHSLKSRHRLGELTRVEIALQVGGDLKLVNEGKAKDLPMSVVANLKYDEQLLAIGAAGHPTRSVRYYDDTRAVIKVEKGGEKPTLDPAHRLIVAEKLDKQPTRSCTAQRSPLKREELDLIDVPGGSLLVDELLPARAGGAGRLLEACRRRPGRPAVARRGQLVRRHRPSWARSKTASPRSPRPARSAPPWRRIAPRSS